MGFGSKGFSPLGGMGSAVVVLLSLLALVGFGFFPDSSGAEPAPVCGNGIGEAGEACDDGNTLDGNCCSAACTIEEARLGNLGTTVCLTPDGASPCDDGIDNDGDGNVDAHDPECATLHLLQQFIFVGTDSKLSVRLGSASHVEQAPVAGRTIAGFPIAGQCDPAGVCTCPNTAEFPAQPRFDCQALGRTCSTDVDCAVPPFPRGLDGAALCGAQV